MKQDLAFASATEDMDALTFGSKVMLRRFTNHPRNIIKIDQEQILKDFEMT